jgi:three-Cys-motif partner protein
VSADGGRAWGVWTRLKLEMLADYLNGFATASKGATERVYLDAFAGEGSGVDRVTGDEFPGSARIALDAGERAGFTRFRFFELESKARELETRLRAEYPDADIRVFGGDCNQTIPEALAELRPIRWAPAFAFVDPDGMEVAWETLAALADQKRGHRSPRSEKPEYKVELWILFPTSGIVRTLALDEAKVTDADIARANRLFGTSAWRAIYELRAAGAISAEQARAEYVNLMRWRLERDLGYRWSHPFEIKNTIGGTLYHMIFSTDHDAGTRIMQAIYGNAAKEFPQMLQEARDRKRGQLALEFDTPYLDQADVGYEYEPPWEPRGLQSAPWSEGS